MENGSRSISAKPKRGKGFRKLRWKNYLNHLLNLWLYCGNVSADGVNGSGAVNLLNKSAPASISASTFTAFVPLSETSVSSSENRKTLHQTVSAFHRSESHVHKSSPHPDSTFNESNKTSLSDGIFHLIKSDSWRKGLLSKPINHAINPDHSAVTDAHKGPPRLTVPENIVNTTRITNDVEAVKYVRVKKSKSSPTNISSGGENKLSIHYNQSSIRRPQPPRNPTNKNVRKKLKSVTNSPSGDPNVTEKSEANRGAKKPSKVSLLGLFEMTTHLGTRWEGKSELAAAELAVKHINERGLLPGYILELITNDTQVIAP